MRVATIMGSPRKKGNTARVLKLFENQTIQNGHEVDRINIVDYEVKGCLGCQSCRKERHKLWCRQDDDAIRIFKRLVATDAVIYASPLYTYSFPAQMKALIDRQNCLVKDYGTSECIAFLKDKRAALLVTCGGPVEENADLIQEAFKRESQYQQMNVVGTYVVPYCTTPDALGNNAIEIAKQMATDIVSEEQAHTANCSSFLT
ncbi:MAG: flavodoxin family protein [Candidatus Bathyarchaeota archaeon]|nr:flavodoxin family protein [Candidatus Bathyarchaeota archaeon]